ncbi:MAG: hypothetical protein KBF51_06070 [Chitinophagales bacterium]|nr:hypothetical protein [Chitinophagales bacterium]MBP9189085.1 hypothetical protein [Chitinophagales bacterium]
MAQFFSIRLCITCIFSLLSVFSFSQKNNEKTNNQDAGEILNDTVLLNKYAQFLTANVESNRDSALIYGYKALDIAKKLDQKYYQGFILCDLAYLYLNIGDYSNSLKFLVEATKLSEEKNIGKNILQTEFIEPYLQGDAEKNRKELQAWIKNSLGILYGLTGSQDKKLKVLLEAEQLIENETTDWYLISGITSNIVEVYITQNKFDSALLYQRKTMEYEKRDTSEIYKGVSLSTIGEIFRLQSKLDSAKKYIFQGLNIMITEENVIGPALAYTSLANIYYDTNHPDSAIFYARKAIFYYGLTGTIIPEIVDVYKILALNYNKNFMYDSAYKYMALATNISDSLSKIHIDNLSKFHSIGSEEKLRLKELETQTIINKNKNRVILLLVVVIVFFIIAFILYRNNKLKQKTNKILGNTLANLKETQTQLIQSEKMASLGELTAGIAHEIQNPLNFVNNFSEVNREMIAEMKEEIKKGNYEEVKIIANDIESNEEKINHHGKRADAIVKGMLQHSRSSTGKKEPTDINALCDEYLRLSYHGLRAKDKNFNATMKTDFDLKLEKINVIPQDIGRVILNLLTNAFYAVGERSKAESPDRIIGVVDEKKKSGITDYEPTVSISTKKINGNVEIKVSDNGNGIPQKVLDKIFQPFFTTKPTGQGTGLGLSLSYDIITKGHGGELLVETKEGEGSKFIIILQV